MDPAHFLSVLVALAVVSSPLVYLAVKHFPRFWRPEWWRGE